MMGMPNPARVRCQFPLALLFPPPLVSSIERGASADFSALLFQRRRA